MSSEVIAGRDSRRVRAARKRQNLGQGGQPIHFGVDHHVRSDLAEPFQTLLSDEVTTAAKRRAETIDHQWQEVADTWTDEATENLVGAGAQVRQGLSFDTLVDVRGFEPTQTAPSAARFDGGDCRGR